ncbi:MAG: DUF2148 domain-containing protein [Bacteroidales bacterium]|jgi:uncharacterized ferredoxin-like protein|nr:DUF2148 domain-containing protein [Bacteroidales bacterium]
MINIKEIAEEQVISLAKTISLAAITAPKARGVDNLEIRIAYGKELEQLSEKLKELHQRTGQEFLLRDSNNVLQSQAVILVGSKVKVLGLDCGYCGFASCKEKEDNAPLAPCFFNSNDLGIAIGSMCSKIADHRIDSRVMFSVGLAAKELSMLSECSTVLAIVLSVSSKSVFFDRVVNK